MPLLSEALTGKEEAIRRRLYTLFTRATKRGDFPALKLLTSFEIEGSKGQKRRVADYAYTRDTAALVETWINEQIATPVGRRGATAEQVAEMTDEELAAMIMASQQKRPVKPKKTRKTSRTKLQVETKPAP